MSRLRYRCSLHGVTVLFMLLLGYGLISKEVVGCMNTEDNFAAIQNAYYFITRRSVALYLQ